MHMVQGELKEFVVGRLVKHGCINIVSWIFFPLLHLISRRVALNLSCIDLLAG